MKTLFGIKKKKARRELAPQLTAYDRRAFALASPPSGALPYPLYDQMERDSMIQTALTLKRLGVLAAPYRIDPADGSDGARRRAEFVEASFDRMEGSPLTILSQAMDAFAKGWSVQELVFELGDQPSAPALADRRSPIAGPLLWLSAVRPKDPSLFGLDLDRFGRLRGLRLQIPGEAEIDLPREKFVVYENRHSYGRAKGRSDLDAAYPHWQARQTLLAAWRLHLERFAMPTVLGKFERGLPSEEQASLLAALKDLSRNLAIVYPHEIEIGTLGGSKEASGGFMEAIEFHNREIARAILGQTLTTDEGRRVGSLALGKVHLQVLALQLAALRRELADRVMTEQVIRPLVELNFGPGAVPRFLFEETPLDAFTQGRVA